MVALSMLTNPAAVVAVIAPAIVNALVQGGRFPLSAASLIGAAELGGMTIALLIGPAYVGTARPRLIACCALVAAIAAHMMSLQSDSVALVACVRAVAGAGEGVVFALAIAALARTPAPERAFGIMITANHVASSVLLALIAWAAMHGRAGAVELIATFLVISAGFVIALNGTGASARDEASAAQSIGPGPAIGGISGVFLLSFGFGTVWPLVGQIAVAEGLTPQTIARALSFSGVGGIVGGMAAAAVGARFGRLQTLLFASLGFGLSLASPASALPLAGVGFAILFFWTMSLPFYLGMASSFDQSGRLAVATSAMIPCGIAAGQAAAGFATTKMTLSAICVAGGCVIAAAAAAMLVADRLFREQSETVAEARA